jgi:AcrR family transcriptional regulator
VLDPKAPPFYATHDDPPSKIGILRAALRLFVERGRDATSIRDIASEAGYTNPALFKFYRSKDELATALFTHCYVRLSDELHAALAVHDRLAPRLGALVERFATLLDEPEDARALLYVQDNLRELWPVVQRRLAGKSIVVLLGRIVRDGREEGQLARGLEPELVAVAIIGTLAQFARQHYFADFEGPARRYAPGLRKVLQRLCL